MAKKFQTIQRDLFALNRRPLDQFRRQAVILPVVEGVVVFGIVGGVVFVAALIAFVLVPRNASRKALAVAAQIEAKSDSSPAVAARDRYLAEG